MHFKSIAVRADRSQPALLMSLGGVDSTKLGSCKCPDCWAVIVLSGVWSLTAEP